MTSAQWLLRLVIASWSTKCLFIASCSWSLTLLWSGSSLTLVSKSLRYLQCMKRFYLLVGHCLLKSCLGRGFLSWWLDLLAAAVVTPPDLFQSVGFGGWLPSCSQVPPSHRCSPPASVCVRRRTSPHPEWQWGALNNQKGTGNCQTQNLNLLFFVISSQKLSGRQCFSSDFLTFWFFFQIPKVYSKKMLTLKVILKKLQISRVFSKKSKFQKICQW